MSLYGGLVEDIMVKNVATADYSASILEAAKLMTEKNIGCVIITKDQKPIGIVTERDFVRRFVAIKKQTSEPISELMTLPVIYVNPEETVRNAADLMRENQIHKLAVIKDQSLVGIITNSDLVKFCSTRLDSEIRQMCDQIITRKKSGKL
ncbi:MAG: CBS domain-containing protein [Nitrosopumilaceae archaeon]|jgi:CBS domain-containing protein